MIVPVTERFAHFASGKWQIARTMPADWPADVARIVMAPGVLAYGRDWPGGHWFIFPVRKELKPGFGCTVFLYSDQTGYAVRPGGPAVVE